MMGQLKDLLVHLDASERTAARLSIAVSLARAHGARLTGIFGQRAQAKQVGVVATWPSDEYVEAARGSKAAFEQATAGLADARWHDVNRGGDSELLRLLTDIALYSDLVILGQHDEGAGASPPPELVEEIVLNSGRPVLVVPYVGNFPTIGQRPLIAWNRSRESARAVNDALVLLGECREATVVSVDTHFDVARTACAAVIEHLSSHGIRARSEVIVAEDVGIMDMLLNRVTDDGADLLVMGGNGSIGLPFVSGGHGTKYILRHMVVPVLMSN
jgi:nucleotide-binding universal stress UspA family protein